MRNSAFAEIFQQRFSSLEFVGKMKSQKILATYGVGTQKSASVTLLPELRKIKRFTTVMLEKTLDSYSRENKRHCRLVIAYVIQRNSAIDD
jgi:hypothetical protein